jgi:hypothetical protein
MRWFPRLVRLAVSVAFLALPQTARAGEPPQSPPGRVVWTTADRLMPAWGVYPNAQPYGETRPLGRWAAWTSLTTAFTIPIR